jgi:hypothetical protein
MCPAASPGGYGGRIGSGGCNTPQTKVDQTPAYDRKFKKRKKKKNGK